MKIHDSRTLTPTVNESYLTLQVKSRISQNGHETSQPPPRRDSYGVKMAFQTRGSQHLSSSRHLRHQLPHDLQKNLSRTFRQSPEPDGSHDPESYLSIVDEIAEAVRKKLIEKGMPLTKTNSNQEVFAQPREAVEQKNRSIGALLKSGAVRIGQLGDTPLQPRSFATQLKEVSRSSAKNPFKTDQQVNDKLEDAELAQKIDHTLLKPDATTEEVVRVCDEAIRHHFATVCVNTTHIGLVAQRLKGSKVLPIAVVGFPLGAASTATKAFETRQAIEAGAKEIDMVVNIGALKNRDYRTVLDDIHQVVAAASPQPVKVILETASLTQEEKVIGCALSKASGAAFVKTSTGFGSGGATVEDIQLMRKVVGPDMGVKASGGIRTHEDAEKMIEAGASRIGASASVEIVTQTDPKKSHRRKGSGGLY